MADEVAYAAAGIRLAGRAAQERAPLLALLERLELDDCVVVESAENHVTCVVRDDVGRAWMPNGDTMGLASRLNLDPLADPTHLEREIVVAMLAGPRVFDFPSFAELAAAIRIRRNIVGAARRTRLAFHAGEAERPAEYWTYSPEHGFTILPGASLLAALESATQPADDGTLYRFSCYRASEYVILLAIARELEITNPPLLAALQRRWQVRPIMSAKFHETFLYEYGSMSDPLPPAYYVPGDRVWFRNPDARSSDIAGYEGSWVFYLGGGRFCNFWQPEATYTLQSKCLEIYHWRHGVFRDAAGALAMDEAAVEQRVRASLADAPSVGPILARMERLRDAPGIYADGGCIDASREFPRSVCPGTATIAVADA